MEGEKTESIYRYLMIEGIGANGIEDGTLWLIRDDGIKIEYQPCDAKGAPTGDDWKLWADYNRQCESIEVSRSILVELFEKNELAL